LFDEIVAKEGLNELSEPFRRIHRATEFPDCRATGVQRLAIVVLGMVA
jgi:hypothetical protein